MRWLTSRRVSQYQSGKLRPTCVGHPISSTKSAPHNCHAVDPKVLVADSFSEEIEVSRQLRIILRKEVIQPQVPLRLPCYDLVPIAEFALDACFLAVSTAALSASHFRGLTGGVYKAQEHIHRSMMTYDY